MTSIEVPYSIAAALPTLAVVDITNEVSREVAESAYARGLAYVSSGPGLSLVRVNERESGFFEDLECLLARLIPNETPDRERLVATLLGPRTECIPFQESRLCLGQWQRVLLVSLDAAHRHDWTVTLLG
jgi:thiamine phosphate synthase YjbQ (UPF0047 family)